MISEMKILKGIKISAAIPFVAFALAACSATAPTAPQPTAPPAPLASASVAPPVVDSTEPTAEAAPSADSMAKDTVPLDSGSTTSSGDPVGGDVMDKSESASVMDKSERTLVLDFSGLNRLANGFHYEGWAIIDGSPVSTGKFNANDDGDLVDLDGKVIENSKFVTEADLSEATVIAITIEPAGDTDSIPSGSKFISGDVSRSSALSGNLSVSHGAALADDFLGASGTYILATPTDGADNNETSGIWYIDLSSGGPTPGLQLPTLPPGFQYEGWVIFDGTPVSTGKFRDVADADSGNPYSGSEPGKPFPGEDFLQNAPAGSTFPTDLSGKVAAISIEPVPDDDPGAPFPLKPLVGVIPDNSEPFTNYQLENQAGGFPTAAAVIN